MLAGKAERTGEHPARAPRVACDREKRPHLDAAAAGSNARTTPAG